MEELDGSDVVDAFGPTGRARGDRDPGLEGGAARRLRRHVFKPLVKAFSYIDYFGIATLWFSMLNSTFWSFWTIYPFRYVPIPL